MFLKQFNCYFLVFKDYWLQKNKSNIKIQFNSSISTTILFVYLPTYLFIVPIFIFNSVFKNKHFFHYPINRPNDYYKPLKIMSLLQIRGDNFAEMFMLTLYSIGIKYVIAKCFRLIEGCNNKLTNPYTFFLH